MVPLKVGLEGNDAHRLHRKGFEQAIEAHPVAHGYAKGNPAAFDPVLALDPDMERNENTSSQFTANEEMRNVAMEWMMRKVFEHFQEAAAAPQPTQTL